MKSEIAKIRFFFNTEIYFLIMIHIFILFWINLLWINGGLTMDILCCIDAIFMVFLRCYESNIYRTHIEEML